jgi:hypothetical protein
MQMGLTVRVDSEREVAPDEPVIAYHYKHQSNKVLARASWTAKEVVPPSSRGGTESKQAQERSRMNLIHVHRLLKATIERKGGCCRSSTHRMIGRHG